MQQFIEKVLSRLEKLDIEYIRSIILDLYNDKQRLAEVINSLPDGIVVVDEEHCLLLKNRAANLLLPLREQSSAGSKVSSEEQSATVAIWNTINDTEIARYLQQTLTNTSGQQNNSASFSFGTVGNLRTLQTEIFPLVRRGRVIGNILRVVDTTEKKNNEARLHRAEQMASLTHLTANVAHEIKNPLAAISIYIQLIKRELNKCPSTNERVTDSVPQIQDHLRIIEEEISRLNSTVVNFLFSVRPMELSLKEVDIHLILDEVIKLFQPELRNARIILVTRYQKDISAIEIDATYIKQAFMNIIKNAIESIVLKKTYNTRWDIGEIKIHTTTTGAKNGGVQIDVIDNGVGIKKEELGKIFDPYFTTKEEGSGIGLMQTDKIIREHNGELSVKNNPKDSGATVTIVLPPSRKRRKLIGEEYAHHTNSR